MKKHIIILCALFALCLIPAVITRSNLRDNLSGNDYSNHIIIGVQDVCENDQNVSVYINKLFKRLDPTVLIAKVKFTGVRDTMYRSVLSVVDVIEVYRGDNVHAGDKIAIYEDASVLRAENTNYLQVETTNLMVPSNEYYVFVNPLNMKNSRTITYEEFTGECDWIGGDDMIWFPPYVYPYILKPSDIAIMTKRKYKYSDIRDYPFLATTKKGAKEIWEIYQAVVEHYGLDTLSDATINP